MTTQGWQTKARRVLRARFPALLAGMTAKSTQRGMDDSITRDELLFDRGWLPLVIETCAKLTLLTPPSKRDLYRVIQIKEKWGDLRIYMSDYNTRMHLVLKSAQRKSARICEICGRPGKLTTGLGAFRGRVQTVCTSHAESGKAEGKTVASSLNI